MAFEIQSSHKKIMIRSEFLMVTKIQSPKKHINHFNSSDDDFIKAGLGGMGYSHNSYKKIIPNYKFITSRFQIGIF